MWVLTVVVILLITFLVYRFVVLQPSNRRVWETGMEKPAEITRTGNIVTIKNLRDLKDKGGEPYYTYASRTIDIKDIVRSWFVFEPFPVKSFPGFNGVAHTYFIFDVKNGPPIAVSVEARREKGERYTAEEGLFNKYELINIWSTENDALIQRSVLRSENQYMFPLTVSSSASQALFAQMIQETQKLANHPRFYNSLLSNCTNELAKAANRIKPGIIPFNIALIFPGYSDRELYKLGLIPHNKPFEEIKKKYYVTDHIKKIYKEDDFSEKLRTYLLK